MSSERAALWVARFFMPGISMAVQELDKTCTSQIDLILNII
ncbi:hypothetical protein C4K40_0942 [Pseudomonas sp. CMR5c]|nr:hypothetical protein C4K40_0942 [Pseudomonas sp. CMR5c]